MVLEVQRTGRGYHAHLNSVKADEEWITSACAVGCPRYRACVCKAQAFKLSIQYMPGDWWYRGRHNHIQEEDIGSNPVCRDAVAQRSEHLNPEVVGSSPTCRIYPPYSSPANLVDEYGWILGSSSSGRARGIWGYSSVGRTSALQAEGQGFESPYLHHRVSRPWE